MFSLDTSSNSDLDYAIDVTASDLAKLRTSPIAVRNPKVASVSTVYRIIDFQLITIMFMVLNLTII